jgi:hypothetical protein
MEQEEESHLVHLDQHKQTIRDLQVFMIQHLEQGFTVNLAMNGNDLDNHSFRAPMETTRMTTPLGFNYDWRISGSILGILEACSLVNIHTLQRGEAPPMHKQGAIQIDFMFLSCSLTVHVEACCILPFDSIFASDHIPLYVDFNIETLFGHPDFGTERSVLRDLQLGNPRLVDAYKDSLSKQLENHNVESRVMLLFQIKEQEWNNRAEGQFNKIDRGIK